MSAPSPGRKSDRTRLAILTAAKDQFAQHGYDRANIRSIAAQAQIDPSMVMRYFVNKGICSPQPLTSICTCRTFARCPGHGWAEC